MESWRRPQSFSLYGVERDRSQPIHNLDPHYTIERFKHPQTVFLSPSATLDPKSGQVKRAGYDYNDRIAGWFSGEDQTQARQQADLVNPDWKTAEHIEAYLRHLYKDPELELVHILSGFNRATGYPYRIYGYLRST